MPFQSKLPSSSLGKEHFDFQNLRPDQQKELDAKLQETLILFNEKKWLLFFIYLEQFFTLIKQILPDNFTPDCLLPFFVELLGKSFSDKFSHVDDKTLQKWRIQLFVLSERFDGSEISYKATTLAAALVYFRASNDNNNDVAFSEIEKSLRDGDMFIADILCRKKLVRLPFNLQTKLRFPRQDVASIDGNKVTIKPNKKLVFSSISKVDSNLKVEIQRVARSSDQLFPLGKSRSLQFKFDHEPEAQLNIGNYSWSLDKPYRDSLGLHDLDDDSFDELLYTLVQMNAQSEEDAKIAKNLATLYYGSVKNQKQLKCLAACALKDEGRRIKLPDMLKFYYKSSPQKRLAYSTLIGFSHMQEELSVYRNRNDGIINANKNQWILMASMSSRIFRGFTKEYRDFQYYKSLSYLLPIFESYSKKEISDVAFYIKLKCWIRLYDADFLPGLLHRKRTRFVSDMKHFARSFKATCIKNNEQDFSENFAALQAASPEDAKTQKLSHVMQDDFVKERGIKYQCVADRGIHQKQLHQLAGDDFRARKALCRIKEIYIKHPKAKKNSFFFRFYAGKKIAKLLDRKRIVIAPGV